MISYIISSLVHIDILGNSGESILGSRVHRSPTRILAYQAAGKYIEYIDGRTKPSTNRKYYEEVENVKMRQEWSTRFKVT